MLMEAASLALRGRMAVDTYFHYRLFDPKLTRAAKRRYLPEAPHANERLWNALTPREYGCLYNNKLIFHRFSNPSACPSLRCSVYSIRPSEARKKAGRCDRLRTWPSYYGHVRRTASSSSRSKASAGT